MLPKLQQQQHPHNFTEMKETKTDNYCRKHGCNGQEILGARHVKSFTLEINLHFQYFREQLLQVYVRCNSIQNKQMV